MCTYWPTWTKYLLSWFDQILVQLILFPDTWHSPILTLTHRQSSINWLHCKTFLEQLWITPFIPLSHIQFFIDSFTPPLSLFCWTFEMLMDLYGQSILPTEIMFLPQWQIPFSPLAIIHLYCLFLLNSTFVFYLIFCSIKILGKA